MQKLLKFFSKNIRVYAIFNYQSFNDTLTNDIISFEELGPELYYIYLQQSICTKTRLRLQILSIFVHDH